jgi:hypothetical protein
MIVHRLTSPSTKTISLPEIHRQTRVSRVYFDEMGVSDHASHRQAFRSPTSISAFSRLIKTNVRGENEVSRDFSDFAYTRQAWCKFDEMSGFRNVNNAIKPPTVRSAGASQALKAGVSILDTQ